MEMMDLAEKEAKAAAQNTQPMPDNATVFPKAAETETDLGRPTLKGHFQIARIDHWVKNVFVLPGIVAALSIAPFQISPDLLTTLLLGMFCTCLIASSNYVINEVLDAPFDRLHPTKCKRPVPAGEVNIPLAYVQWIGLGVVGVGLGTLISAPFAITMGVFWLMGCIYNIPPVRSKDTPYLDVLSEAVNNPLRMLAGWYMVGPEVIPPASLLLSYWMVGCYFMAIKRYAEVRDITDKKRLISYRKSFNFYTPERLLVSIMFYSASAMLFFGAFIMRYRMELILVFPIVALIMAMYLALSFKQDSAVQAPENLWREPSLIIPVVTCSVLIVALFFIDLPILHDIFTPTGTTQPPVTDGITQSLNP